MKSRQGKQVTGSVGLPSQNSGIVSQKTGFQDQGSTGLLQTPTPIQGQAPLRTPRRGTTASTIELASGTTVGSEHIGTGEAFVFHPNQDAYATGKVNTCEHLAFVCDGCSAGKSSHVGATFAAKFLIKQLQEKLEGVSVRSQAQFEGILRDLQQSLVAEIRRQTKQLQAADEEYEDVLRDFFLFTIMGMFIGKRYTAIFSIGDGEFGYNGECWILEAEKKNKPGYAAYNTVAALRTQFGDALDFVVHIFEPTPDMQNAWISSDGAKQLRETLGDDGFKEYLETDLLFSNPALLSRKLRNINNPGMDLDMAQNPSGWTIRKIMSAGPLTDDTTLVLARKRCDEPEAEQESIGTQTPSQSTSYPGTSPASTSTKRTGLFGLFGNGQQGSKTDDTFVD